MRSREAQRICGAAFDPRTTEHDRATRPRQSPLERRSLDVAALSRCERSEANGPLVSLPSPAICGGSNGSAAKSGQQSPGKCALACLGEQLGRPPSHFPCPALSHCRLCDHARRLRRRAERAASALVSPHQPAIGGPSGSTKASEASVYSAERTYRHRLAYAYPETFGRNCSIPSLRCWRRGPQQIPRNARTHSKKQIRQIARSIGAFRLHQSGADR